MRAIAFLVLYYPFHELVLKLSGASGAALFLLRQWPDVAIIFLFLFVACSRTLKPKLLWSKAGLFLPFVLFFSWAVVLSVSTSGNSLRVAFSEIFVLARFIFLFATIVLLAPSLRQAQTLVRLIMLSAAIQGFIALVQFFGGPAVLEYFKPADYVSIISNIERSFTSNREGASRVMIGTTGDFLSISYLIAIGLFATFVSGYSRIHKVALLAAGFTVLFMCGSRTIFLGAVMTVLLFIVMSQRLNRKVLYSVVLIGLAVPSFLFFREMAQHQNYEYASFLSLFDPRIFESLLNQRLGVLIFVIPEYVLSGHFVLGLSPDRFYIADVISRDYEGVPVIVATLFPKIVEDIYPLALFLYYGLPGVMLLGIVFLRLFRSAKAVYRSSNVQLGALSLMMLLGVVCFSLGNQALENRLFSFHFWLIMGLATAAIITRKSRNAYSACS